MIDIKTFYVDAKTNVEFEEGGLYPDLDDFCGEMGNVVDREGQEAEKYLCFRLSDDRVFFISYDERIAGFESRKGCQYQENEK